MNIEELEARIRVLEDIESIKKLRATYCYLSDAGLADPKNRDELVSHLTKNAKLDFGKEKVDGSLPPQSRWEGIEGLKKFFGHVVPSGVSFCMHMVHNPIIEVNGDTATGRWYYEAPATKASNGEAQWMAGAYWDEYVKENGEWKISYQRMEWKYITPYDQGWAKVRGI